MPLELDMPCMKTRHVDVKVHQVDLGEGFKMKLNRKLRRWDSRKWTDLRASNLIRLASRRLVSSPARKCWEIPDAERSDDNGVSLCHAYWKMKRAIVQKKRKNQDSTRKSLESSGVPLLVKIWMDFDSYYNIFVRLLVSVSDHWSNDYDINCKRHT